MNGIWLAVLIIALSVVTNWLQKVFAGLLGLAKSQTILIESAEKAGLKDLQARVNAEFLLTFLVMLLFAVAFLLSALGLIGAICFAVSRYVL